jgi:hypothetical protein
VQAGPVGQPGRFPFGGVERLVIDKQAVFIKAERLFELNQHLFRQAVPMLLLQDQPAEQCTPRQAPESQQYAFRRREPRLHGTQKQRKDHRDQAERTERRQPDHVLAPLIHFILVEWIENGEGLLNAFGDHGRSFNPARIRSVSYQIPDEPVGHGGGHGSEILAPRKLMVRLRQEVQPLRTSQRVQQAPALMKRHQLVAGALDD